MYTTYMYMYIEMHTTFCVIFLTNLKCCNEYLGHNLALACPL